MSDAFNEAVFENALVQYLANGALASNTSNEGVIRRNIINDDLVEGIISLPAQLFYTVQIPVSLWFISRNKEQKVKKHRILPQATLHE